MSFELSSVCVLPPFYMRVATVATVVFAIWCLVTRFRKGPPVLLATVPLLLYVPVVWIGFVNTARATDVAGYSRIAVAAGHAEALTSLVIGAAVSAGLALSAAVLARRGNRAVAVLIAVALTHALIAALAWQAVDHYRRIAKGSSVAALLANDPRPIEAAVREGRVVWASSLPLAPRAKGRLEAHTTRHRRGCDSARAQRGRRPVSHARSTRRC